MLKLAPLVRVLDLDGSIVEGQREIITALGAAYLPIAARDLGPRLRYMALPAPMRRLSERLLPEDRHCLTLYGSGDFHHVTAALLRVFPASDSLSVVVFDRHPDWDSRSPVPCCGSWVLEALRLACVRRVVVIGLGSEDITGWRINVGSMRELHSGRVAFYPHHCRVSYGFGSGVRSTPAQPAPHFSRGPLPGTQTILWQTIELHTLPDDGADFLGRIFDDLPTEQVYVSIDKDCLAPEFALSNWEPGHLALAQVEKALALLAARRDIVGADITGEYSVPTISSPFFSFLGPVGSPLVRARSCSLTSPNPHAKR